MAVRPTHVHHIGKNKPGFGTSFAKVEVIASVVVDVAERDAHGSHRHVEDLFVSFEGPVRFLKKNHAMAGTVLVGMSTKNHLFHRASSVARASL